MNILRIATTIGAHLSRHAKEAGMGPLDAEVQDNEVVYTLGPDRPAVAVLFRTSGELVVNRLGRSSSATLTDMPAYAVAALIWSLLD